MLKSVHCICILLKNWQPCLYMNNSFLSNQSILCLVSKEKSCLWAQYFSVFFFISSCIAFSIILNMFTMIRGFQQGLATGNYCNLTEYKFVDVDFVLGITSLQSCWQEFVAIVTLGIPSSETWYISHFEVSAPTGDTAYTFKITLSLSNSFLFSRQPCIFFLPLTVSYSLRLLCLLQPEAQTFSPLWFSDMIKQKKK